MHKMMKYAALACSLLLVVASGEALAAKKTGNPAEVYIQSVGDQALLTISNKNLSEATKQATLQKMFHENLDFDWVSKFVLGRFWRQATDDQRTRYFNAYRDFLTKHYTARFSEYTSGSFKITGSKEIGDGDTLVNMEIASGTAGEPPILIDYKVHKATSGQLKVFDIIVEGVSLITTQRSEFASVVNKNGIDGLIAQLQAK